MFDQNAQPNAIPVAIFATAADAQNISALFDSLYPNQYAMIFKYTDFADSRSRQSVIDSDIKLVIVHQGVDGFTTSGLHEMATKQGTTPRVVVGIVTTEGDIYDVALQYDVVPFRPPVRKAIIDEIHRGYPQYLAEAIQRFSRRESIPERFDIPEEAMPHLMSMPGNVRQALQILTFWSSKGGVGKSTIAIEMARILADVAGRHVLLVDADVSRGYVGPRMGKRAEEAVFNNQNITNLAQTFMMNGNSLKGIENYIFRQPPIVKGSDSNLDIILGLKTMEQATLPCFLGDNGKQGETFIKALCQYAQNMGYEFLLFDIGPTVLTPVHRAAIEVASTMMVITTPVYPSIKPTVDGIETLEEEKIKSRSQMRLIINEWVEPERGIDLGFTESDYPEFSHVTLLGTLPAVHQKYIYPIVNHAQLITDWFVTSKDPPNELSDLIRGYLNLCESFSAGTRKAGAAKFENLKIAVTGGREGILGNKNKRSLFGGKKGGHQ
jgi:MinD-like ATPase involved in chromosome partitioning or flagellar assembly